MTIDTNVLVAYLQGDESIVETLSIWKQSGRALLMSSISRAEVLSRPDLTAAEISETRRFLDNFISVVFDDQLAGVAGDLRRRYRLSLPDAAIAATALSRNVSLVTRDRQFRKVKELTVIAV